MSVPAHLIAVDLDGTLFGADGQVSARTQRTLAKVSQRGHHIVAVTGRSRVTAAERLQPIRCIERIVCSNGSYEFCSLRQQIVWEQSASAQQVDRWCELVRVELPEASFGWETGRGLYFEEAFVTAAGGPEELEQGG